jgi:hypothetical protein
LLKPQRTLRDTFVLARFAEAVSRDLPRRLVALSVLVILILAWSPSAVALAADSVAGTVQNRSTGRAAAGDDVILLRLGEGMQEEARTKTDDQGAFNLPVKTPNAQYVVRVLHQGVNYDRPAAANVQVDVFDAVPRISGITGSMGIAQIDSDGRFLRVTEMYAITNAATPPVTQVSPRNFPVTVPDTAVLDWVQVRTQGGIWTKAAAKNTPEKKNVYAVDFPLRPGDTLFKIQYHLPYTGPTKLHLKLAYPIKQFAVVHAPSLAFKAERPNTFKAPAVTNGVQFEAAATSPLVGDVPAFVVSGTGIALSPATGARTAPPAAAAQPPALGQSNPPNLASPTNPAVSSAPRPATDSHAPLQQPSRQAWWILGGVALVLVGGMAFAIWRMRRPRGTLPLQPSTEPSPLLTALKEELFELENDRLRGSISAEEYESAKRALNVGIERALARASGQSAIVS